VADRNAFTDSLSEGLVRWGLEDFVYVPSSHVAPMIAFLQEAGVKSYMANREDEAVAIAGGLVLGGRRAALVIQDNGFGNAMTALTTFVKAYHVGLPVIANTRGGLGEYNAMIHTYSESVPATLKAAGIRVEKLAPSDPPEVWRETATAAAELAKISHRPVVVLADVMHPAGGVLG
jgi:sulfopyruvate decarboxylase subunit alpha